MSNFVTKGLENQHLSSFVFQIEKLQTQLNLEPPTSVHGGGLAPTLARALELPIT